MISAILLTSEFTQKYTKLFDLIFTYATPFFKLAFMIFGAIYGIELLIDLAWIVHQIRKNAEAFNDEDKKRGQ